MPRFPNPYLHWIGYINIFATIWISILSVHMYGHLTSYSHHVIWNTFIHPLISVSLPTWWLALVFKWRTYTVMSFTKDVWSSSWLRSWYFLQSSQVHTRVCGLCVFVSKHSWPRSAASSRLEPAAEHPRVSLSHCGQPGWEWHHPHPETGGEREQSNLHATIINHTKLHHHTRWLSDRFPRPV